MTDEPDDENPGESASDCESFTWQNDDGVGGTYIFPHGAAGFCAEGNFVALRISDTTGNIEGLAGAESVWQAIGNPNRPAAVKSIKPA